MLIGHSLIMPKYLSKVVVFLYLSTAAVLEVSALENNVMWQFDFDRTEYSTDLHCIGALQGFRLLELEEDKLEIIFDKSASSGKKVLPYLGNHIVKTSGTCKLDESASQFIARYSNSGLIHSWHMIDEPEGREITASCQEQLYSEIKRIDRKTPISISTNTSRSVGFEQYLSRNSFDILMFHRYVNPSIARAQIRQLEEIKKLNLLNKKLIVTLRAFNSPKPRRIDMKLSDIVRQLTFYDSATVELDGIGFYGWKLSPNSGISQQELLKEEYSRSVNLLEKMERCE